jgi:hypothetical protein
LRNVESEISAQSVRNAFETHINQNMDFDPARGSEQAGTRPAVIVERTAFSSVAAKRHVLGAASFDIDKLIEICRENDAAMIGVFGSFARGEGTSASDN